MSQPPAAAPVLAKAELAVMPAAETANLPISTEPSVQLSNGTLKEMTLKDDQGRSIGGHLREDNSSWVPDQPLTFGTKYTVAARATGEDGNDVTQSTSFSTMADPGARSDTGLYLFDNNEYGIAMPIVVEFPEGVEDDHRAIVEKRLFVTTDPPQAGAWSWTNHRQAMYRAENFWLPGTKITVRSALDGVPFGGGKWGDQDRRATVNIATNRVELFIDNGTKQLTVRENGADTRSMPVSLGKSSTPSSSGTMVIMDKQAQTVFDTTGEPGDQYRADVSYAQRLTWGGEFIHAAPWSVGDQGVNNVSHGCVNMSWGDAEWLFGVTHVGDPVVVTGTEQELASGNGFTAWNRTWSDHVKGSALPQR